MGGWRSHEICKKYPGSGFLPYLRHIDQIVGSEESSSFDPKDTVVISEEAHPTALKLIDQGAKGAVLFCLESPLFTPIFYDHVQELRPMFQHQILFQGGSKPVYFPSFDLEDLKKPDPWEGRRPRICAVISNKHFKAYEAVPGWKESRSWQHAVKFQRHDERFLTIHHLMEAKLLDLYGKGWPPSMASPIPDGEKIDVLRRYRFGLCIENTAMPGYVTEKIIDCLIAGVIPIYAGAPDIEQFVPPECFMRLDNLMGKTQNASDAWAMIEAGQEFLRSEKGQRFSYQGFANQILELLAAPSSEASPKESRYPSDSQPSPPSVG